MNLAAAYVRDLYCASVDGWNRFWFAPADPATLCMIRILAGAMLFYTHLVWTLGLEDFFGASSWVSAEAARMALPSDYTWSYFWWIDSTAELRAAHVAALAVFACLTLGLGGRVMAALAFVATVSYVNRTPGALFGLDQINALLAMYLAVGPCTAEYSLDRWLAWRRSGQIGHAAPSTTANLAIRLIQVHMCVIYFFAGLSKLQGETWWSGTALWGAAANLEYQTVDLTWMAHWPLAVALLTQIVCYWELFFCVLVWPKILRPAVLVVAIPLHLGIAFCMGMITFGLVMLIGVSSFISPSLVRALLGGAPPVAVAEEQGTAAAKPPARSAKPRRPTHATATTRPRAGSQGFQARP